jgi:hypothetical protein
MTDLTQDCPYCKETIKADAIRCRYCSSWLGNSGPTHGGTCPFCKENIKTDALKCKHCGSMLVAEARLGAHPMMAANEGYLPQAFKPPWEPNEVNRLNYPGMVQCRWVLKPMLTGVWDLECDVVSIPPFY